MNKGMNNFNSFAQYLAALGLLLFSFEGFAYSLKNISITTYEFRRYARPQLKSISNEFQTLFFSLNEELSPFKAPYTRFKEVGALNHEINKDCDYQKFSDECRQILSKVAVLLEKNLQDFSQVQFPEKADIRKLMGFQNKFELLSQALTQNLLRVQNLLFQHRLIGAFGFDVGHLNSELNYLFDNFHSFLFENSDPRFRNEFNSFWLNFIRPVDRHVIQGNSIETFKNKITEFNLRWNLLNVSLTKRNYKAPKKAQALLNIMHRRWNNILKVSLKPK